MKRGSFAIAGSNWFTLPQRFDERQWKAERDLLDKEHRALRRAIARLQRRDLSRRPGGSTFDVASTIFGAASHDLYHAGQVQLLKRLVRKR